MKHLGKISLCVAASALAITTCVSSVSAATSINSLLGGSTISQSTGSSAYSTMFSRIISVIVAVAALLSFFYLVWGAVDWITSGGDQSKVESARHKITAAVIGLIILAASWAIFQLVLYVGFGTDDIGIESINNGSGGTTSSNSGSGSSGSGSSGATRAVNTNITTTKKTTNTGSLASKASTAKTTKTTTKDGTLTIESSANGAPSEALSGVGVKAGSISNNSTNNNSLVTIGREDDVSNGTITISHELDTNVSSAIGNASVPAGSISIR
ncbi:hypothetical protein IJJ27_03915 [bacterium]|nr:hypothetical protein [bacterium]